MEPASVALVLSGAAALGAYQVGVLDHLLTSVAHDVGGTTFDVLCGTSAGALNAAALASDADMPLAAVERMADVWTSLVLDRVLRPSAVELLAMAADLGGDHTRLRRALALLGARGGLVGRRPLEQLCKKVVRPAWIEDHLHGRRLRALAVAATDVATGQARVFFDGSAPLRPHAGATMVRTAITPAHVMASASIPLLFPPVDIDGELYCDGGLRQVVPLSPALHLGAKRVLMITASADVTPDPEVARARRDAASSPFYLAGKALDALFTESIDGDVDRLHQLNRVLEAGRRRFGPSFVDSIGRELTAMGAPAVTPVELVHLRPSRDLGALAAEYIASPDSARWLRGPLGRVFRRLVARAPTRAGGLLSYLLFDGGFAARLIELGREDARNRHAELVGLFGHRRAA